VDARLARIGGAHNQGVRGVIDRAMVKKLREEMLLEIGAVAEKHGLKAEAVNARFDSSQVTFQFRITLGGAAGEEQERADFARRAPMVALDPGVYGKEFRSGGGLYRAIRINLRARSAPVICVCVNNGRLYKFPVELVRRQTEQEA